MKKWQDQSKEVRKRLRGQIIATLESQHGLDIDTISGVLKECFNVDSNSPGTMSDEISRISPVEFKRAINRYIQRRKTEQYYGVA